MAGLGMVDLDDVAAAVKETHRVAEKGLRGIMIWASAPESKPYGHPDYEPFWAAAQDVDLPVSLHALTGRSGPKLNVRKLLRSYIEQPHIMRLTLGEVVYSGILERHPRLRLVSAENDVGWMTHFMYRIDHGYERFRHFDGVKLSLQPSEYIRRQVSFAFQSEEIGMDLIERLGADNLMWSSDYPHSDSTWPHSREYVRALLKRLPDDLTRKIVGANAARMYQLG